MSCKSQIYVVNTTQGTAIAEGADYVPTSIIRRYGKYCNLGDNGVIIGNQCDGRGSLGYYDIDATVTVTATSAGVVTASLYKDGVAIPGATSSVTAANGNVVTLPLTAVVRHKCPCDQSVITVVVNGAPTSYNLALEVEKE